MKKRSTPPAKAPKGSGNKKPGASTPRGGLVRSNTLEKIWSVLGQGFVEAKEKLVEYLEVAYKRNLGNFAINDPDADVRRRTSPHEYEGFGPPAWFEAPFYILKVWVREANRAYMTHGGEEILFNLPGSDGVEYEFFWPDGAPPPFKDGRSGLITPVDAGHLIRINPSLLHRNRLVERETNRRPGNLVATSWIILRPVSLSSATLLDRSGPQQEGGDLAYDPHSLAEDRVKALTGAQFLLVASGIWEKIRVHRQRSELSVEELSSKSKLNRSYVGRLERLDFDNFSIQTLFEISRRLDLDLVGCFDHFAWAHHVQPIPDSTEPLASFSKPPAMGDHLLHPAMLRLPQGESCNIQVFGEIVSIIVISGEMLPRPRHEVDVEMDVRVIKPGEVFHVRRCSELKLFALSALEALVIRCSTRCTCEAAQEES